MWLGHTVNGDKMLFWEKTTPLYRAPLQRRGMIPLLRRGARRAGWSRKCLFIDGSQSIMNFKQKSRVLCEQSIRLELFGRKKIILSIYQAKWANSLFASAIR